MSDYDFSLLPDQPKQYDFSALPDQPWPELSPDQMIPDFGDQSGYAPAQPLFTSVPRPPERLYRENAPQILQDVWNTASPESMVGPLREHQLRPDLRMDSPGVYALPDEPYIPANLMQEAEMGLRKGAAYSAAYVLSLGYALAKGELPDEREGYTPIRQEAFQKTYDAITRVLQVKDVAEPDSFSAALIRGIGESGMSLVVMLGLSALTEGATAPSWAGLATEYPTLVAKVAPIVNSALTQGLQGGLEPYQPGTQAATGAAIGAILGVMSPYGRIARSVVGAGLGAGQEYFTNPDATTEDVIRNATLMAGFAALAAKEGLTLKETIKETIWDWAKNKGYTPEEFNNILKVQGTEPVLNEFAKDMTAPQMENRSGAVFGTRPGEKIGTIEHPIETIPDPNKTEHGGQSLEQSTRLLRTLFDRFGDRGKALPAYDPEAASKFIADNPEARIEDAPNYSAYVKPVLDAEEKFGSGGEPAPGVAGADVWERREGAVPPDQHGRIIAGTQEPIVGERQGEYAELTETPEFKEWFGASKVVCKKGEWDPYQNPGGIAGIPRMVYYGTPERLSADLFRPDERGVILFTTSTDGALEIAGKEGEVIPAYLKIENPLEIKAYNGVSIDAAIDEAKAQGKDGVIYDRYYGNYTYAVFSPDQVKSPLNRGIFEQNDSGAFNNTYRSNAQYTTLAQAFQKIKKIAVEIIGLPVKSDADLAVLAQSWRNPNYEELRYVYIRNGVIVDHEGVTCRLPMASKAFLGDSVEGIKHIKERIAALGADSLYLVHNHPSGNLKASGEDLDLTLTVANQVPEMKGHIIINSGKYAFIDLKGEAKPYDLPNLPEKWIDPILTASVPHEILGEPLKWPWEIAAWSKALTAERNRPLIVYLNPKFEVRGLQEINPGGSLDWKQLADAMPEKLVDFGSAHAVLILPERSRGYMLEIGESLVRRGVFYNVVSVDKDGPHSVLDIGTAVEKKRFGGRPLSDFPAQPIR